LREFSVEIHASISTFLVLTQTNKTRPKHEMLKVFTLDTGGVSFARYLNEKTLILSCWLQPHNIYCLYITGTVSPNTMKRVSLKAIEMSRLDWRLIELNLLVYCFVCCSLHKSDVGIIVDSIFVCFVIKISTTE
jgi:hypothetical protein